jgi:hypothetical protein
MFRAMSDHGGEVLIEGELEVATPNQLGEAAGHV